MSLFEHQDGRVSLSIASPGLKPYVTHMTGGRDISCRAILPENRATLRAFPRPAWTARRLYAPSEDDTRLLKKLRKQVPSVYLDLVHKFTFLTSWQDALGENIRTLEALNSQLPDDPEAMSDQEQSALVEKYLETMFNYFATMVEVFTTHEHVLSLEIWHAEQPALGKLHFRQLNVLGDFYMAFEQGVNQLDRVLFAEIPAKIDAGTITLVDVFGWGEELASAYFEAHEKAIALVDAK